MNGKMPMFGKVSLIRFAYNVIYTFVFPNEHVKNTLATNDIDLLFSYVKFSLITEVQWRQYFFFNFN